MSKRYVLDISGGNRHVSNIDPAPVEKTLNETKSTFNFIVIIFLIF